MTVSSTNRKAGPYAGNGSATSFAFHFRVFEDSDVVVVHTDVNGAETVLEAPADYTVTLNLQQETTPGGTINMVETPVTGELVTITSELEYIQPLEITNQGGFYPKVVNAALDRLTILCQQLGEQVGRAVKVGISSSANPDDIVAGLGSAASVAIEAASTAGSAAASAVAGANSAIAAAEAAAVSAAEAAAVTPTMVADGAVSAPAKLANNVVTTSKVVNNAITAAKMAREGTAGQFLISGGPSADPAYGDLNIITVPVGGIIDFTGNLPPTGFIKANGALLSRTAFAALWAHAQTSGNLSANDGAWEAGKFSPGDGSTTFRIPDLRGEFRRGWDDGRGIDSGRAIGTAQDHALFSHTHTGSTSSAGSHQHSGVVGGFGDALAIGYNAAIGMTGVAGDHTHALIINSTGGSETRPRNVALLACIKY